MLLRLLPGNFICHIVRLWVDGRFHCGRCRIVFFFFFFDSIYVRLWVQNHM